MGVSIIKLGVLMAFTFLVGERVIPKLLGYVAATRSRELFTLTVLVVALGIAMGAAKLFGASMALGAFLAGMAVGRSDFSLRAAGMRATAEIIRLARELNPKISVLVRANYLHEIAALRHAGADHVFTDEGEVALAMTEFILRQLGATPEQIDHERDRIRAELFGGAEPAEAIAADSIHTPAHSAAQSPNSPDRWSP